VSPPRRGPPGSPPPRCPPPPSLACPGQDPPFWAVKRFACPYKNAMQTRFTVGNAKGA
jgi:hypothetical protein